MSTSRGDGGSSTSQHLLIAIGGFVLVVAAGLAIAFVVVRASDNSTGAEIPTAEPTAFPTITVTAEPREEEEPELPIPQETVTVTAAPVWPAGFWSPGSPCLIPFPGVELGLEFGFTRDQTIKSWVFGVQELIQRLYDRGWTFSPPGPIDGEYGAKTEAGVLGFQQYYGELQTGRVDATTWAALRNQCERFRA